MKNKALKTETLANSMELPAESFKKETHIEVCGSSKCVIEGLECIEKYTPDSIKVNLGKKSITIHGSDLVITSFIKGMAIIEGIIVTIDFSGDAV